MLMKNPPHPGQTIKLDCLDPLGLTVTKATPVLGITRQALSNVINGRVGISAEMAIRISKAFGGTPEVWLRMQTAYDLVQAQKKKINVQKYELA